MENRKKNHLIDYYLKMDFIQRKRNENFSSDRFAVGGNATFFLGGGGE